MYHLEIDALGCVNEENMHECKDDFYQWCCLNIKSCDNGILKLTDVVNAFIGKNDLHSKKLTSYKTIIEQVIKEYHSGVKYEYGKVRFDKDTFYGWKHLQIGS